jgi:putative chitinase
MTPIELRLFCAAAEPFYDGLVKACALFHIDTPLRQAHFLAQCAHESAGFTRMVENLNYSEHVLLQAFPARVTPEWARELAHKPEQIANFVYGGRNGNDAPGDGWKYRGRAPIGLTGKKNYARVTAELRLLDPTFPDLVELPDAAASTQHGPLIAGCFWNDNRINVYADRDDLLAVSRAVNLGNPSSRKTPNGLRDREQWLVRIKGVLS